MNEETTTPPLTLILQRARAGDIEAKKAIFPLVYEKLRVIARKKMRGAGHTLQPTALVHEAYMRSLGSDGDFENRRHFYFVASQAMRDILVDHARRKGAAKRGGNVAHVDVDDVGAAIEPPSVDMLALQDGLRALEADHPRAHQVVMLRYFGGVTIEVCAELLDVARRTVDREWRFARAFLKDYLESA